MAIANGLAIGVMVCALGHISGGHFNPAITFGFLITRKIKPALAGVYWVAQFGGAALAALFVKELLPRATTEAVKLGVPALGHGVDASSGFLLEAILTFFLVFVVFGAAVDTRGPFNAVAGLAIGLTISIDVLFGGPFTGRRDEPLARLWAPAGRRPLVQRLGVVRRASARGARSPRCCTRSSTCASCRTPTAPPPAELEPEAAGWHRALVWAVALGRTTPVGRARGRAT